MEPILDSILDQLPRDFRANIEPEQFHDQQEPNGSSRNGAGGPNSNLHQHHRNQSAPIGFKAVTKNLDNTSLLAVLSLPCKCKPSSCLSWFSLEQLRSFRTKYWVDLSTVSRKKFMRENLEGPFFTFRILGVLGLICVM